MANTVRQKGHSLFISFCKDPVGGWMSAAMKPHLLAIRLKTDYKCQKKIPWPGCWPVFSLSE